MHLLGKSPGILSILLYTGQALLTKTDPAPHVHRAGVENPFRSDALFS